MKRLLLIALTLISTIGVAQSNYEKGMNKAFELWGTNPVEASNLFERIAAAEKDNWLPPYYAAQVLIIQGFEIKDKDKLDSQLKKAQGLINDATAISKGNPEIIILQALLHTVWVAYDGATYGMTLAPKVAALYEQAAKIDPNNPRVILNKAEWGMGSARFFGQDTTPFCKDIERALELFANFKPETPFHPNWGKERAEEVLASCRK
ncbi:hypothetical protein MWU58_08115 [Flavobacteriaceae bacterium S0825]|uniref:hypothetical protein n=1 Tax=Gaetbulibacter sp. S0825 TaxID=2720084 RepID=UPI001431C069|nr:hypothetical protein [Gaetbulibacter sp. S0825]MCK0109254.1 hypothetical protein [Flavobacteriaceae bacterium S0825]NIX64889.1 hypothetical protein [Gaetbulibacter sp. S0825]